MMCNIIFASNVEHMPLTTIMARLVVVVLVYLTRYEIECKHNHTWSNKYLVLVLWQ